MGGGPHPARAASRLAPDAPGPSTRPGRDRAVGRPATSRSGRVRARVEAPLGATLTVQAGAQSVRIPLARLLDGPQRTVPPATIDVGAAAGSAWDAIEVDPGDFAGRPPPRCCAARVPVRLGLNVLTSDASEVDLRFTAELKSVATGGVAWQHEQRAVVASDALDPTAWMLSIPAPPAEGLYALEVRAAWEPAPADGARIRRGRPPPWRRKPAASAWGTATGRVTLAVVDPKAKPATATKSARGAAEESVDAIDLARPRGHRPSASGRAPGSGASWRIPESAVRIEETRRTTGSGAGSAGASGEPVVLPAGRRLGPGLVGRRPEGPPTPVSSAPPADRRRRRRPPLGGWGSASSPRAERRGKARVVLDALRSGPPLIEGAGPSTFSWLVLARGGPSRMLVLVNRNASSAVRLERLVGLRRAGRRPARPGDRRKPDRHGGRTLGIDLTAPSAAHDRFGGAGDPLVAGRHLAKYLDYCGATAVVLPDALADRGRRQAARPAQAEEVTPSAPTGSETCSLTAQARPPRPGGLGRRRDGRGAARAPRPRLGGGAPGARARPDRRRGQGRRPGVPPDPRRGPRRHRWPGWSSPPRGSGDLHPSVAGVLVRLRPRVDAARPARLRAWTPTATLPPGSSPRSSTRRLAARRSRASTRWTTAGSPPALPGFLDGDGQEALKLAWARRRAGGGLPELAEAVAGAAPEGEASWWRRPTSTRASSATRSAGSTASGSGRPAGVAIGRARPRRLAVGRGRRGMADRPAGRRPLARGVRPATSPSWPRAGRPGRRRGRAGESGWARRGQSEPAPEPTLAAPALPDAPRPSTSPWATPWRRLDGPLVLREPGGRRRPRGAGSAASAQTIRSLPAQAQGPAEPRAAVGHVAAREPWSAPATAPRPISRLRPTTRPIRSRSRRSSAVPRGPASPTSPGPPPGAEPVAGACGVVADLPPFGVASARGRRRGDARLRRPPPGRPGPRRDEGPIRGPRLDPRPAQPPGRRRPPTPARPA